MYGKIFENSPRLTEKYNWALVFSNGHISHVHEQGHMQTHFMFNTRMGSSLSHYLNVVGNLNI